MTTEEERKAAAEKIGKIYYTTDGGLPEITIMLQCALTRTEKECQSLKRTINHLAGGAAQGLLAHAKRNPPAEGE